MADGAAPASLLVVIVDTNNAWWGKQAQKSDPDKFTLTKCIDSILAFANAHLIMQHENDAVIIASQGNKSYYLYPHPSPEYQLLHHVSSDGRLEQFTRMNGIVKERLQEIILSEPHELYSDCVIAGAIGMALCYINKREKQLKVNQNIASRILIIKGSEDNSEQYMNLMNSVFTAQKQNVLIDACILDNPSSLLQQACQITGGLYLKVPHASGLLQYLLWVFLPDASTRDRLSLPPQPELNCKAACFCHRNLIDIGFVCSVCLSIFCTFSPICSTCQTTFKLALVSAPLKKKLKR